MSSRLASVIWFAICLALGPAADRSPPPLSSAPALSHLEPQGLEGIAERPVAVLVRAIGKSDDPRRGFGPQAGLLPPHGGTGAPAAAGRQRPQTNRQTPAQRRISPNARAPPASIA